MAGKHIEVGVVVKNRRARAYCGNCYQTVHDPTHCVAAMPAATLKRGGVLKISRPGGYQGCPGQ